MMHCYTTGIRIRNRQCWASVRNYQKAVCKTMSIPNFGDSVPILDVDPVLFFKQINELIDTALTYDFQASSDFSVVETAMAKRTYIG